MALAGTAKSTDSQLLLEDAKEAFEHQLVVDGIYKSLSQFCKNIETGPRSLLNLGKLCHLKTQITAELSKRQIDLNEIIQCLHPTPALGNYPKSSFRFERSCPWLGSPLGYHDGKEDAAFLVTLRGLRVLEKHVELSTGCGVTENSQFEKELKELKLKRQSVKESFSL